MRKVYLAVDFGGGSGRVMAGWLENGHIVMEEVHRFGNRQVRLGGHLYWDFPALFEDMKAGLKAAAAKGYNVVSIGIDTWGVDLGLLTATVCFLEIRSAIVMSVRRVCRMNSPELLPLPTVIVPQVFRLWK